jgi:hypothetical protein
MRILLPVLALALCACGDPVDAARTELVERWSCPAERIEVTRTGLDGAELYRSSVKRWVPPPDIAQDPSRLAVFEKTETERIERVAAGFGNATVLDAKGCGFSERLLCYRRNKKRFTEPWHYCQTATF